MHHLHHVHHVHAGAAHHLHHASALAEDDGRLKVAVFPIADAVIFHIALFLLGEAGIGDDENRKHGECYEGRPLNEEAEHDEHKGGIVRVPDLGIGSGCCQTVIALGLVEHMPGFGEQEESDDDEEIACEVNGIEVRTAFPSDEGLEQLAGVVGHEIKLRIPLPQPAGEEINRQRKAVHFDEERHDEGGEGAEGAPIAFALRLEKAEGEEDEQERIEDNECWHYEKEPMPFKKTGFGRRQNSVVADKDEFKAWLLRAVLNPAKSGHVRDPLLSDVPIVPMMSL